MAQELPLQSAAQSPCYTTLTNLQAVFVASSLGRQECSKSVGAQMSFCHGMLLLTVTWLSWCPLSSSTITFLPAAMAFT